MELKHRHMQFLVLSMGLSICNILAAQPAQSPTQVVNGAVNPELIPDWRVYRVFFRFLANRSGRELTAIVGYLQQIHLGGEACTTCLVSPTQEDAQIKSLLATAQSFYSKELELDIALKTSLEQNPGLNVQSQFDQLSARKEALCADFIKSLDTVLGPADAAKVRAHVQRMKTKIKLVQ